MQATPDTLATPLATGTAEVWSPVIPGTPRPPEALEPAAQRAPVEST